MNPDNIQTTKEMDSTRYIPTETKEDGGKGQRDLIRRLNGEIHDLKNRISELEKAQPIEAYMHRAGK